MEVSTKKSSQCKSGTIATFYHFHKLSGKFVKIKLLQIVMVSMNAKQLKEELCELCIQNSANVYYYENFVKQVAKSLGYSTSSVE